MLRWALRIALILILLPLVLVGALFAALNTSAGQDFAAGQVASLTGGAVKLDGLRGRFPDRLRLARLEVHDADGAWLTADDVALDWSPTALLHGQALVDQLRAARLDLPRLPRSAPASDAPAPAGEPFQLPVRVTVLHAAIPAAAVGAPVLGHAALLGLVAKADLPSLQAGTAELAIASGGGSYTLVASLDDQRIEAALNAQEPAGGLLARLASLPDLGAIRLAASTAGPRSALSTKLDLTAGPLAARATALIDTDAARATVDVTATAPAMTPAPGVAWQSVKLDAHVSGPFTAPDATGTLRIDGVEAGGASLRSLVAQLAGNAGQATLNATLDGLRIPGPNPALLAAAPVELQATAQLDDPARPVRFTVGHPLLAATGTARTAGALAADVNLRLPDLAPLGTLAGLDLAGHSAFDLHVVQPGGVTSIDVAGALTLEKGPAPAPALLGPDAKLALSATLSGNDVALRRLSLDGARLKLDASGTSTPAGLDVTAKAAVSDLAVLAPTLTGAAALEARVTGQPSDLAAHAVLTGDVGAPGVPQGPVRLVADLKGLPGAPSGRITGSGTLAGAPVQLALEAQRGPDGTLRATIERADWRSLHAEGAVALPAGATLPQGRVLLRMTDLNDLRPFVGQPVAGSIEATARLDAGSATVDAEARNAGVPGNKVGRATLKARVADPLGNPVVAATLDAAGIAAAGYTGSARVEANGPQGALAIKATADLAGSGNTARLAAAALLDVPAKQVRVNSLDLTGSTAGIQPETVRLLAPATVRFGNGVAVDRLRLGVRTAVLDVAGQLSPRLDATATLRTPADIAAAFAPTYAADGSIALDARLTGTPAAPGGTVRLNAAGLRLRTGPGRALPPANLNATVALNGTTARVDARLAAGSANLAVSGTAPLGQGALGLRANGALDLALLDPILSPAGRRARGRVALDATIGGTTAQPSVSGTATLAGVEVQDFGQGLRLAGINGTVRAQGETAQLDLAGRAGPGTLNVAGTVGVLAPALPLDLRITMRNARPLASDLITADLDADITLRGPATEGLTAAGRILVRRAELNIPRTLPASVVTLDVRRPGDKPPAPAAAATPVRLDLTLDAPQAVFVRGRGVDAELGGSLRIRGDSGKPQVGGGLEMRRGSISVAGTTLNFTRGKVGFDGTGVTGKIDPTLDFAADSSAGGVTATLSIGGYVSDPKIKLSSVPDLPQDEVLAYLIFKRSAKELGPFQVAEIAAAIAELTGVGGGGLNPLESVRKGLGLDRLSLGAGTGNSTTPTVEAGRYISNGVYLGAKQGTTGGQTQATVQIDITKGLKLETDVGSGTGGNSVGLTYQFEY